MLNEKHIIDRDIAHDKIFLDEADNIKISISEISSLEGKSIEETTQSNILGPINFLVPEILMGQKPNYLSVIYMLGLTFFILTSNKYYLRRNYEEKKFKTHYTHEIIPSIYSDELKNFDMNLLQQKDKSSHPKIL